MAIINKGVRTEHPDYTANKAKWKKCRDCDSGEDAIKHASTDYLPKLTGQPIDEYRDYLTRGTFYNATARTIDGLQGMIFRKPAIKEVPTMIEPMLLDIDLCGSPIEVFTQEIVEEILTVGRVGLLVDHPVAINLVDKPLTQDVAQKANLRPTLKIYVTESIINWKFKQINNVWSLCMVVLKEQAALPSDDEFEQKVEDRYRVLDLFDDTTYRMRVFRIDDRGNDELLTTEIPLMNNAPLTWIPFLLVCEDGTKFDIEDPPLYDLINVNLAHWRVSCDYEHGCHFTALPTLVITGYTANIPNQGEPPEAITLGSRSAILLSDPSADAKFVEFTGQGLQSLEQNLDRKEGQMATLGARMLAPEKKAVESTQTTEIHRNGENSVLSQISQGCSLGLAKALTWFSKWAGAEQECKYELNRDFLPVSVDSQTLAAVMKAYQGGAMSKEELFDWMQRGDLIEADVTFEDHNKGEFVEQPDPNALKPPVGSPVASA